MEERSVAVEVEAEGHERVSEVKDKFDALREEVAVRGGVALHSPEEGRYGARFHVTADEPAEAVDAGVAALEEAAQAASMPEGRVVDVEAPTLEELGHHGGGRELPELIEMSGLGKMLGVNRHLAPIIARSKGFPPPAAELNGGPVWARESVDRFLRFAARRDEEEGENPDGQPLSDLGIRGDDD